MQPGTNPEDIHTILSRFNHWSGTVIANGNGHVKGLKGLDAGVREIPYEEAMRLMRNRRTGNTPGVAVADPAAESAQPAVIHDAILAEARPAAALPETKVRGTGRAEKRVTRKRAGVKKTLAAKTAKAPQPKPAPEKQPRYLGHRAHAERTPEFRQVLARSVRAAKPEDKATRAKETGRDQRVSVRLSRTEEDRLQTCAAKAGVTVSEYLRMRALDLETASVELRAVATAAPFHGKSAVETAPETARPARSGLGDWIALLRNRFLASPVRFAERA
jgi:hypothetical protein